ncbi:MAG: TraB/GumN family protein [Flavobacteriales bacterium]|nr:TraB/GumN family protein [Flavobacteriales bacterium]
MTYSNRIRLTIGFAASVMFLSSFLLPKHEEKQKLLYEISKEGQRTSFVFGTTHMIPSSQFVYSDHLQTCIKSSSKMILELDMDDPTLPLVMLKSIAMKGDTTIRDLLSDEEEALLDSTLQKSTGIGLDFYNTWKPMLLVTLTGLETTTGTSEMSSYELELVQTAASLQMPIEGLETVDTQMAIFDRIPYQVQATDLMDMISGEDDFSIDNLFKAYTEGDADGLYEIMLQESSEAEMEFIVNQRNRNWIPKINDLTAEDTCFIAFGSGHLSGPYGVLKLLQEDGWEVKELW